MKDWKKILEGKLAEIGWKLKPCTGDDDYRLIDDRGASSGLILNKGIISQQNAFKNTMVLVNLKDVEIEKISTGDICISGKTSKSIYILLRTKVRSCRLCGCTEIKACQTDNGPCYWVEGDLCSACQGSAKKTSIKAVKKRSAGK